MQGTDALSVCAQSLSMDAYKWSNPVGARMHRPQTTTIAMDAKPYKHTQALTEMSGLVYVALAVNTNGTVRYKKLLREAKQMH